jgi:hypothetical protein
MRASVHEWRILPTLERFQQGNELLELQVWSGRWCLRNFWHVNSFAVRVMPLVQNPLVPLREMAIWLSTLAM